MTQFSFKLVHAITDHWKIFLNSHLYSFLFSLFKLKIWWKKIKRSIYKLVGFLNDSNGHNIILVEWIWKLLLEIKIEYELMNVQLDMFLYIWISNNNTVNLTYLIENYEYSECVGISFTRIFHKFVFFFFCVIQD